MAGKMVSLRLDEELLEWATAYGEAEGLSRTAVLERGLRVLRGEAVSEGPVSELASSRGGRRIDSTDDVRRWAIERQAKLNAAKDRA